MEPGPTPVVEPPKAAAMDVVPPPVGKPPAASDKVPKADRPKLPNLATKEASKPAVVKEPGNGVGLAIFATVVIVLGLAALAVYAYLKSR